MALPRAGYRTHRIGSGPVDIPGMASICSSALPATNIDPDYEFRPKQDYLHDFRLMKHHLKCHNKTMKELAHWR